MPRRLTDNQIIDALTAAMGKVCLAAEKLGCRPEVIYARAKVSARVGGTIRFFRGKLLDAAESALWKAILEGESWAVRLALAEWGRSRSFSDGAEVWHAPEWRDAQATGELVREIVQEVLNQYESTADPPASPVDP